jgi:hypothetical protein
LKKKKTYQGSRTHLGPIPLVSVLLIPVFLILMADGHIKVVVDMLVDDKVPEKEDEEGPKGMPRSAALNQSWKRSSFSSSNGVRNWVVYSVHLHGHWSMELSLLPFISMRNIRLRCSLQHLRCRSNARRECE